MWFFWFCLLEKVIHLRSRIANTHFIDAAVEVTRPLFCLFVCLSFPCIPVANHHTMCVCVLLMLNRLPQKFRKNEYSTVAGSRNNARISK